MPYRLGLEISKGQEMSVSISHGPVMAEMSVPKDPAFELSEPKGQSMDVTSTSVRVGSGRDVDDYDGPYEVTPTLDGFDMPVKDTAMLDDVTVNPIPIAKVSNEAGGYTYIIG